MRLKTPLFIAASAVVGLSAAGSAMAQQPQKIAVRSDAAVAPVVMICANDTETRRGFVREYGAPPVFVTAEQAMAVARSGQTHPAPLCMTAREHQRLTRALEN